MKRLLLCVVALLAGSLLSGCDAVVQEVLFDVQTIAQSEDPRAKTAGNAPEAGQTEKESREHFKEGVESRDPNEITRAVDLKPLDVRYRAYQIALLIAYSDDPSWKREQENSAANLRFILASTSDNRRFGQNERLYFLSFYLPALQQFFDQFGHDTTEAAKYKKAICGVRQDLASLGTPAAKRILEANPDNANCLPS